MTTRQSGQHLERNIIATFASPHCDSTCQHPAQARGLSCGRSGCALLCLCCVQQRRVQLRYIDRLGDSVSTTRHSWMIYSIQCGKDSSDVHRRLNTSVTIPAAPNSCSTTRPNGIVGYYARLTRERSPVRSWVRSVDREGRACFLAPLTGCSTHHPCFQLVFYVSPLHSFHSLPVSTAHRLTSLASDSAFRRVLSMSSLVQPPP